MEGNVHGYPRKCGLKLNPHCILQLGMGSRRQRAGDQENRGKKKSLFRKYNC